MQDMMLSTPPIEDLTPAPSINDPVVEWFLTQCHVHRYPAKYTLIHAGEKAESLYYIVSGSVSVFVKDDEHKEMLLTNLGQGEFLGEISLFEEKLQTRTAWVKTKETCEIAEISYKRFKQIVHINPEILMYLSAQMARRLRQTSSQVSNLALLEPDAMTHPEGMQIKITRQEIGQMVGCSRETVGRILKMLEDDDLISAHGKTIVVFHKQLQKAMGT